MDISGLADIVGSCVMTAIHLQDSPIPMALQTDADYLRTIKEEYGLEQMTMAWLS